MKLNAGVAALAGLVLGAGVALAWNPPTIDVQLRVGPDPRKRAETPVLAALPFGRARGLS